MRALAAAAAKNGILAPDREDVRRFTERVRWVKAIDPTLELYSALAYAEVGLTRHIPSVQSRVRSYLGVDLFDIAALSGSLHAQPDDRDLIVPFCPMLNQTWSFLPHRGISLPDVLADCGRDRIPSLWTTFGTRAMRNLVNVFERGALS
jgi:hypothetical protein